MMFSKGGEARRGQSSFLDWFSQRLSALGRIWGRFGNAESAGWHSRRFALRAGRRSISASRWCFPRSPLRCNRSANPSTADFLLVETPRGNLSRAIGWLQTTYTVRFNRRHRRSGHLFQGRFKAHLVEADSYVSVTPSTPIRMSRTLA